MRRGRWGNVPGGGRREVLVIPRFSLRMSTAGVLVDGEFGYRSPMGSTNEEIWQIRPVLGEDPGSHDSESGREAISRSLHILLGHLEPSLRTVQIEQLLGQAAAGQLSFEGLLEARIGERLCGVIWVQVLAGKTATVWNPVVDAGRAPDAESCAQRLIDAAAEFVASRPVRVAQALLNDSSEAMASYFQAAEFEHVADLQYVVSMIFPHTDPAAETATQFEPWGADNQPEFEATIAATYEETMDCPVLNGVRAMDDVLAGYRATGQHDAALWNLVRSGKEIVGCLLCADHPQTDQLELVYMGIVPAARGRRLGLLVARYAQWLAHQRGRKRVVLAVDAENEPALAMYRAAGFVPWEKRAVLLRIFPS